MRETWKNSIRVAAVGAACLLGLATAASAKTYNLRAAATTLVMADGTTVPAWGFADDTAAGPGQGAITVPGPQLTVTAPDTTLTINLTNTLQVPVSIMVAGQSYTPPTPTLVDGRVMSLAQEVAPGSTGTITLNNLKPGTFLYESSTNPSVQIPLGLYGALVVNPAPPLPPASATAYNSLASAYDSQNVVLFSAIDPALNAAITAAPTTPHPTLDFKPRYFLINGKSFPQIPEMSIPTGQPNGTLLRMLNASDHDIVPVLTIPTPTGKEIKIIAEDGNMLNWPRYQFAINMPAGKTLDVLVKPSAGTSGYYSLFDRRIGTTNGQITYGSMYVRKQGPVEYTPSGNDVSPPGGITAFIGVWGLNQTCSPLKGDVDGDGKITIADALYLLRAAIGLPVPPYVASNLMNGDVAPLDTATGLPCGDVNTAAVAPAPQFNITVADALLVLQKAVGLNPY